MSGALSALVDAVTGNSLLVLGGLVFTDFALPSAMSHGGQQQLTTHKLPGGARVIDDMGDDPAAVSWSGLWLGLDASTQRAALEALRTAGDPVDLTWSDQALTVIISDCRYDEEHAGRRIRYRITCTVLPDTADDDDTGSGESDLGTGETPDTASQAQDAGQRQTTRARSNAAAAPTATNSAAVRSDADAMMAGVTARQAAGSGTRQLGAAP